MSADMKQESRLNERARHEKWWREETFFVNKRTLVHVGRGSAVSMKKLTCGALEAEGEGKLRLRKMTMKQGVD